MAVIEEDVVQISWDIEDSPFLDLLNEFREFEETVSKTVNSAEDELEGLGDVADDVANDIRQMSSASGDLVDLGNVADSVASDIDKISCAAKEAEADAGGLANELKGVGSLDIGDAAGDLTRGLTLSQSKLKSVFGDIKQLAGFKLTGLTTSFNNIGNSLQNFKNNAKQGFAALKDDTKSFFAELSKGKEDVEAISSTFDNMFDKIKTGLATAGVAAGLGAIVKGANNSTVAINKFQAATGSSAEDMLLYGNDIKDMYSNGVGESLEDISTAMATVKNNSSFDHEEVGAMTEDLLILRDTYDYDVGESIRSTQMLMDQFGVSGMDSMNLIAQATQNGLDKNGDLLDTINEYSVHFKQLGFDAPEMFNMLINGAKNGTFSVDKLGDAVKEFGIRVIDGSDTTAEGFKAIGLDANEMATAFKAGGETGKQAFLKTVNALKDMEDPIAQNTAGVNLFGTMWEDLGSDGVFALANLNGEIDMSVDKMDEIRNIRYDDAGSALMSLGRTINVSLADSVSDAVNKSKGYINDFTAGLKGQDTGTFFGDLGSKTADLGQKMKEAAGFAVEHKNAIKNLATVFAPLVVAIGLYNAAMVINKGLTIAGTVAKLAYCAVTGTAVSEELAATAATWGLNAALLANPVTWVVLGVLLLIGVIILLVTHFETVKTVASNVWTAIKTKAAEAWEGIKSVFGNIKDWFAEKFNAAKDAIVNKFNEILAFVSGLKTKFLNAGKDIMTGLYNGLTSKMSQIVDKIKQFGQDIVSTIKDFFKIGSPSRLMKKIGGWVTEGFNIGLTGELGDTEDIAAQLNTIVSAPVEGYKNPNATNEWRPESSSYTTTNSNSSENNTYAPVFNLNVYGDNSNAKNLERQVKKWFRECLSETAGSMSRANPRVTEV